MSQFYCRDEELRKLNKRYENGKFECVVIYGRRRVGKTALINEFCKELPRYKRPRRIIFEDVPRNATGKIEKPLLRKKHKSDNLVAAENNA